MPQTLKKVGQVIVILRTRTERDDYLCLASRSRGEYLRTHFKNMREVGAALRGKSCVCVWLGGTNYFHRSEIDQGLRLSRRR